MIKTVFVDTSAIAALLNKGDQNHQHARDILGQLQENQTVLIITNYVRAETHALLLHRAGIVIASKFLSSKSFYLEWVGREDEKKAIEIIKRYRDKKFSLTDAVSFVIMERMDLKTAFTYDRHFAQYGWQVL